MQRRAGIRHLSSVWNQPGSGSTGPTCASLLGVFSQQSADKSSSAGEVLSVCSFQTHQQHSLSRSATRTPPVGSHFTRLRTRQNRAATSFLPLSHTFVCATDGSPAQTYPHPAAAPDIFILQLVKAPVATPPPGIEWRLSPLGEGGRGWGGEVLLAQGTRPVTELSFRRARVRRARTWGLNPACKERSST